jgi:alkylated DNA repair dioxygenase AlkB
MIIFFADFSHEKSFAFLLPGGMKGARQQSLTTFFSRPDSKREGSGNVATIKRRRRSHDGSSFGTCPLCSTSFPLHKLEAHAADCNGEQAVVKESEKKNRINHISEPVPGLYLFENFVSEEEEAQILAELDGHSEAFRHEYLPWKASKINGMHLGKRWGVHCNLRDRKVSASEHPLPNFVQTIVMAKLSKLKPMVGCIPNEANAIDYRKNDGHYLESHVDDRQLSKEPIANLSLAGDCIMTFTNVAPNRNTAIAVKKVLLKRRCLQVLTGKARYDFSHGIQREDLLSDRRVSVTMRESPLTTTTTNVASCSKRAQALEQWWLQKSSVSVADTSILPTREPIPGLFVYEEFISSEEETLLLRHLDTIQPEWKTERHSGFHREKRFGVDYDLWSRTVRAPKQPMPSCLDSILQRLKHVSAMMGLTPNEANVLDYQKALGHFLKAHVDDRGKHKEPIANLSLGGDCFMTFVTRQNETKVFLKRRCLQIMTDKARYEYTHEIMNADLLSPRRVSVTMRVTP